MNCLCCGKPLRSDDMEIGWHKGCIKRFFGTARFPEIEIDEKAIEFLAAESANKGYTVPGVQKKLSLHSGYILKPQVEDFEALPEAEQLVMCMADAVGISTVPHALIKGSGSFAYITKRVDRIFNKDNVQMLAMEDFCQLDLRLTQDKYKGSYERCAKIINKYSSRKGLDMTELYIRLVFSFIVGNSDMHLKNFSLLETKEGSGTYLLSPAYDLLPVNVILSEDEDEEEFALMMNGKKMNIQRNDFLIFADECGIPHNSAVKMIAMLVSKKDKLIEMCRNSLLPEYLKERFITLMETRIKILVN